MKFEDFIKNGQVKDVSKDVQLAKALVSTADQDMSFLNSLTVNTLSSRKIISNYYDVLRSLLEADASLDGFKIYSHEAFTYYLIKNGEENHAREFERFRKIRNSINYYAKQISIEEAEDITYDIKALIEEIKQSLSKKLEN